MNLYCFGVEEWRGSDLGVVTITNKKLKSVKFRHSPYVSAIDGPLRIELELIRIPIYFEYILNTEQNR